MTASHAPIPPQPEPRIKPSRAACLRAAWAVAAIFALVGTGFAAWAARVASIKIALGLTPGQVGILLACGTGGSMLGLIIAGRLNRYASSQKLISAAFVLWAFGVILLGLGADMFFNYGLTACGLFFAGMGTGSADVTMNVEGAHVEQALGRAIMPRFHAAFSAGTVFMTLLAVGIVYFKVPVWANMLAVAVVLPPLAFASLRAFLPEDRAAKKHSREHAKSSGHSRWREPRTLAIGVMVMMFSITEGAANDWLPLAMVEGYHAPQWVGIATLGVFLTAMTLGRLSGTILLDRFGRLPTLWGSTGLAIVGSLLFVFGPLWTAPIGAILWGVGGSLGFPVGMSAAADDPIRAAQRVSVVGVIAYTAFLGGPPLIGFIADHVGVLRAMLITTAMACAALFFIPATKPIPPSQPRVH